MRGGERSGWSSVLLFGAEHGPYLRLVGSIGSAGLRASSPSERSKQALTGPGDVLSGIPPGLVRLGALLPG